MTFNLKQLIASSKVNLERHPIYEFKNPETHVPSIKKWLKYDYESGLLIPYDGDYSILFVENDNCPLFIWFAHPYREHLLWSWAKNGNWGSKVPRHPAGNAWHYMTDGNIDINLEHRETHPNESVVETARRFLDPMRGTNSGTSIGFYIMDPMISRGLVRRYDTKETLKFPDIFACIYCGEHDWRKEDSRWEAGK